MGQFLLKCLWGTWPCHKNSFCVKSPRPTAKNDKQAIKKDIIRELNLLVFCIFTAIFGSCLSPDFDLNYPDFYFHRKSGLFRTGLSINCQNEISRLNQKVGGDFLKIWQNIIHIYWGFHQKLWARTGTWFFWPISSQSLTVSFDKKKLVNQKISFPKTQY